MSRVRSQKSEVRISNRPFGLSYLNKGLFLSFLFLIISSATTFAETREFTLTVTDSSIDLNGTKFMVYKYNEMFPAPEIRVKEGDMVTVKLRNTSSSKHGLFFHGLFVDPKTSEQEETIVVDPGYEYVYGPFPAKPGGTHLYHCSVNMAEHMSRGMYGFFIVDRKDDPKYDKEFLYILSDWNTKAAKGEGSHELGHPKTMGEYDLTAINDRAVTGDNPVVMDVKKGEKIRIRLASVGMLARKIRFPEGFTITHADGYPIAKPKKEYSFVILPGQSYDMAVTADKPGKFTFYHSIYTPPGAYQKLMAEEKQKLQGHDDKSHFKSGHEGHSHDTSGAKEIPVMVLDVKGGKP